MSRSIRFTEQTEGADCGAACLKMIFDFYGLNIPLFKIKQECPLEKNGITLKGLSIVAESFRFRTNGVKLTFAGDAFESGVLDVQLPCIAFWKLRHYIVIYKANKNYVWVADPAFGKKKYARKEFEKSWVTDNQKGVLLLLEPQPEFYDHLPGGESVSENEKKTTGFLHLFRYLQGYRPLVIQLLLGLLITSTFTLVLPFLTQMVVDKAIVNQDLNLVYMLLMAQLILFAGKLLINTLQSWIFLHIGTRVNVSLIHDFLIKLMKLPISFFNRRIVGDLLQRIQDHQKINAFITGSSITVIFSLTNALLFSVVLYLYSGALFALFWLGSAIYILWILAFFRKRAELDNRFFELYSANQSKLIEIIDGIQEIKLQNSERKRRWQWVNLQAKIFRLNIKSLLVSQLQRTGANFINQLKNIMLSFFSAIAVINGDMSLGMMVSVQFIIGSINGPLESLISFFQSAQTAKLSFNRLNEIHQFSDEDTNSQTSINFVPAEGNIRIEDLSFQYAKDRPSVLEHINLEIHKNKITAIVGSSGSGKTTLLKLLLNFYTPTKGRIMIGSYPLSAIRKDTWRRNCGAVLQDSFIFPDTVAHNIAESDDMVVNDKLYKAARAANAQEFIETLHAGYNTAIGAHGINLSQGQIQRILIARAVYKDPSYLFLDEATNSLDATNESQILHNLQRIYSGKTVIIVAHRLSTVKHADQIIVLDKGKIVETGDHESLLKLDGHYAHLIANQIDLETYSTV